MDPYEGTYSQEWSEDNLRDLIKEIFDEELTTYHWEEVAPLIEQLERLGHKPKKANQYKFIPRNKKPKFKSYFSNLAVLLYQKGYILKTDSLKFEKSFDGLGNESPNNVVKWTGQENLCIYQYRSSI